MTLTRGQWKKPTNLDFPILEKTKLKFGGFHWLLFLQNKI